MLATQRLYLDAVDNLKLQLGVPSTLALELDDRPLRPIRQQLLRFETVYADLSNVQTAAEKSDPSEEPARYRDRWKKLLTESALVRGTTFSKKVMSELDAVSKQSNADLEKLLKTKLENRRKLLDVKIEREIAGKPELPTEAMEIEAAENEILRELDGFGKEWNSVLPRQRRKRLGSFSIGSFKSGLRDQHLPALAESKLVHNCR